ncbi:MAG: hypothetical protein WDN23_03985 [Edaphobacter sp.]
MEVASVDFFDRQKLAPLSLEMGANLCPGWLEEVCAKFFVGKEEMRAILFSFLSSSWVNDEREVGTAFSFPGLCMVRGGTTTDGFAAPGPTEEEW